MSAHGDAADLDDKVADHIPGAPGLDLKVLLGLVHVVEARQQEVKQHVSQESHLDDATVRREMDWTCILFL